MQLHGQTSWEANSCSSRKARRQTRLLNIVLPEAFLFEKLTTRANRGSPGAPTRRQLGITGKSSHSLTLLQAQRRLDNEASKPQAGSTS